MSERWFHFATLHFMSIICNGTQLCALEFIIYDTFLEHPQSAFTNSDFLDSNYFKLGVENI